MNKRAGPLVVGETLEKSSAKLSGIDSEKRKTLMNSVTKLRLKQAAAAVLSVCVVGTMLTLTAPGVAADATISQTFSYTGATTTFTVPSGVTSLGVTLKGGQGGRGGHDSQGTPETGGFAGLVQGTMSVAPGDVLTIAVGGGGGTGVSGAGNGAGGTGGLNPLAGFDGGVGGRTGNLGGSGAGGGGGAASVIQVGATQVVAAGAGGNGGSGQFLPIVGRRAEDHFVARADATTTVGRNGIKPEEVAGVSADGGGSGAGGGGAQGGEQGADQYGGASATEWFGFGGYPGSNSTAGYSGLVDSYQFYSGNSGNGSITITYTVGVPDPPRSVVGAAGNGLIDVYWMTPVSEGSSPITDYIVKYSTSSTGPWTTFSDGVSTSLHSTITGLSNGTPYFLQVIAVNGAGESLPSTQSTFPVTPTATPDPKPILLHAFGGDQMAYLEWSDLSTPGATVTDYQVEYATSVGGPWTAFSHPVSTDQNISVTGLANGTPYLFRVAAVTTMGQEPFSNAASATPLGNPTPPVITSITPLSSNLQVNFTPPTNTGGSPITSYQYQLDGGAWVTAPQTSSPIIIGGLTNGQTYSVKLRAITAATTGVESLAVTGTPYGLPGLVPGFIASPSSSSVTLDWDAANANGSPITDYNVIQWSAQNAGSILSSQLVPGSARTATFSGLSAGTKYFTIEALNAAGTGPRTAQRVLAVVGGTPPAAPTVDSVISNGTSVSLDWTSGAAGSHAINGYTIRFISDDGDVALLRNSSSVGDSATVTLPSVEPYRIEIAERSDAGAGAVRTVRPPIATTGSATVNSLVTEADLSGTVNANNSSSTFFVQMATSIPGLGSPGNEFAATPASDSSATPTAVTLDDQPVDPATTYYYRVVARSGSMVTYGATQSFTTNTLVEVTVTPKSYDGQPVDDNITSDPGGLAISESWEGINGTVYGPSASAPSEAGQYRVTATVTTPGYTGSDTYDVTISPATQVVTMSGVDTTARVGEVDTIVASSSASLGTTLSIIEGAGTVCNLNGTSLTMVGAGDCLIQASQAGSRNFSAAASTMRITVSGAAAPVTPTIPVTPATPASPSGDLGNAGGSAGAGAGDSAGTGNRSSSGSAGDADAKLAFTGATLWYLFLPGAAMTIGGVFMVLGDPRRRRQTRRVD